MDISTGKFLATEIKGAEVWNKLADEISRIAPAECILPEYLYTSEFFNIRMLGNGIGTLTRVKGENFIKNNMTELLMTHFKTASLEGLGFNEMPVAAYAVAAILNFLQDTQKRSLSYLNQVQTYNTNQHMVLDATTRRNLEITSTMRDESEKRFSVGGLRRYQNSHGRASVKRMAGKNHYYLRPSSNRGWMG